MKDLDCTVLEGHREQAFFTKKHASKGKGTEPEKLRNKRSSESNKNLFE